MVAYVTDGALSTQGIVAMVEHEAVGVAGQVTDVVYPGGMSIQVAEPVAVLMGRINQCQAELACPTPVAR